MANEMAAYRHSTLVIYYSIAAKFHIYYSNQSLA